MNKKKFSPDITDFIERYNLDLQSLIPLKIDASERKYYRIKKANQNYILVDSTLEKASMKKFIKISEWLQQNKFSAPYIYEKNLLKGISLIEDFGENKFGYVIKKNSSDKIMLYKKTIKLLKKLSSTPLAQFLPDYSYKMFKTELDTFIDWYFFPEKKNDKGLLKEWDTIWRNYYKIIASSKFRSVILRDFHVDNLFLLGNRNGIRKIGLIDFQDAVIGHTCYDLVSLLQDVRVNISNKDHKLLYDYHISINNISESDFEDSYFIFGTQRLLKIAGIFKRLKHKNNKTIYVKYIPRTLRLLKNNLNVSVMTDAKEILKYGFKHDA